MYQEKCIFCKICSHKEPTDILYEDDDIVVFNDIKPAAKYHYLVIPKSHIKAPNVLTKDQKPLVEKMISTGKDVLQKHSGDLSDVRLGFHWPPFNSISHLHLHVISPASEMGFVSRQIFKPNTLWFVTADYVLDRLDASKL